MDLDVDPSWVMWKAGFLEVVWVLTELFATLEVVKPVPPLEMVLVCWGCFELEDFHSEAVVAVVVRVNFFSMVDM